MNDNELLGKEKVGKLLWSLALPAVTAQVVNMLYNIVDRIYIGHIPETGALALTGVGLCFPVLTLISAFSGLVGMGGGPRASICLGRKEHQNAEKILGNCVSTLVLLAVVLTAFFLGGGKALLYAFGASDATIGYAFSYMKIYVCGTTFVMISLGLNTFISAQGFARVSMATTLIGAVTNLVLDPIFIFGFHMGVQGAAIATVLSQAVSALWVLRFLTGKKTILRIRRENLRVEKKVILPVIALGMAPFIMTSTESLLNICFNTSLQKYGGDLAVCSMTILSSIMQILGLPTQGISQGAQPITSYNYGAGKLDRVRECFWLLFKVSVIFTTGYWLLNMVFPGLLPRIFAGDEEVLSMTAWANRIYMAGGFMLGIQFSCQQTFVALGEAKASLFLAFLRKIFLLIPLIYILPHFFENKVFAVFLAEPVADILAASCTFALFIHKEHHIIFEKKQKILKSL